MSQSTTPEYRSRYWQEYTRRPEVRAARAEYFARPEIKARRQEYARRPDVKFRRKLQRAGVSP